MKDIDKLLDSLSKSKFRGSFHLNNKMKEFVITKGIDKVKQDTKEIVIKNLKIKRYNDGKQTTMRQVHPTFISQHATGTCCRGCLQRIHHIDDKHDLTDDEINYITDVIIKWILREVNNK